MTEFNGKYGQGRFFSITILAQNGDQINGKFFNDAVTSTTRHKKGKPATHSKMVSSNSLTSGFLPGL